jgi:hypothetical protein
MTMDVVLGAWRENGHAEDRRRCPDGLFRDQPANVHADPASVGKPRVGAGLLDGNLVGMTFDGHDNLSKGELEWRESVVSVTVRQFQDVRQTT